MITKKNFQSKKIQLEKKKADNNMTTINENLIFEEIDAESLPQYEPKVVEILELLGKGGFGEVWRAFDKRLRKLVVLKFMNRFNIEKKDVIADFMMEISLLKKIDSIHNFSSLKVLDILIEKEEGKQDRYIIEIESGDIDLKQILDVRKSFGLEEAEYILRILAMEYQHLEEHGIAHCDVKPDNVILCRNEKDEDFSFKISDFGISVSLEKGEKLLLCDQMQGMTKLYASPEVKEIEYMDFEKNEEHMKKQYDPFMADVYSLGKLLMKVLNKKKDEIAHSSIPLHVLINSMISDNPTDRPCFSEIAKQCTNMKPIHPKGLKDDIVEYRKLMQKKQFFGYLKTTFYKYLELDLENQANLYLATMNAVENQTLENRIYINIAEADLILFFHKDLDAAWVLYSKASDICDASTLNLQVTAEMRIANMFDMYTMDKKRYKTQKKLSDEELGYKRMSTVLDNAIYSWWDHLSVAGINNLGIHDCMSGREWDCITRLTHVRKEFGVHNYNNLGIAYQKLKKTSEAKKIFQECEEKLKVERWRIFQNPVHVNTFERNKKKFEHEGEKNLEFIFVFDDCYEGK